MGAGIRTDPVGSGRERVESVGQAQSLVNRAGVTLVFPGDCDVLPSLWEAVTGSRVADVFTVNEQGRRVLSPELDRVWSLKNELAEQRRACVGKHVRGRLTLISVDAVPLFYARTRRSGHIDDFDDPALMPRFELELARALREQGPATAPELRRLVGSRDARATRQALDSLQRRFVVTQTGEAEQRAGWPAAVHDLVARRFRDRLRRLPARDAAVAELAARLLHASGELAAADLALAVGTSRDEAAAALARLAQEGRASRLEGRILVWAAAGQQSRPRPIARSRLRSDAIAKSITSEGPATPSSR